MTDPTKVERLEVWRCVECAAVTGVTEQPHTLSCSRPESDPISVIPAQDYDRMEQALRKLVEAGELAIPAISDLTLREYFAAALSQAREILGDK